MPTYRWERSDILITIGIEILLRIIHSHATLDIRRILTFISKLSIRILRHTLIRAIFMSKVHGGRPVVGQIFCVYASRACGLLADVSCHRCVEGIAADDLVDVCGRDLAGFNEGIESLN